MVTQPAPFRLKLLAQTLRDFARQTHAERELVVVVDAVTAAEASPVLRTVQASGVAGVRPIVAGGRYTLGALRNLSWAAARGDVVCPWDDDDRHHPDRLAQQRAALDASGAPACYLQDIVHFFAPERRLHLVNFRPAPDPVAVNTPMLRRDVPARYPEEGDAARMGEDTALFRALRDGGVHPLEDAPHLFAYVHHGRNTCSEAHHRQLVELMGASRGKLLRHEARLRQTLAPLELGPVTVAGRNGDAFTLGDQTSETETVSA